MEKSMHVSIKNKSISISPQTFTQSYLYSYGSFMLKMAVNQIHFSTLVPALNVITYTYTNMYVIMYMNIVQVLPVKLCDTFVYMTSTSNCKLELVK